MDKYIGRLLDNRYEILEAIGTGGMAVVYKARCHRLNRLVAIKILKDDYLQDEEFRRRFHSESQAVAMLGHPNIVSVYDVSSSLMADYIVMELIDGITLKQYMEKKGTLNWKETLHFGIQIAKALEHAHSRGIVHRDIKPHNVMVLKNGSVKVMDFGIARLMSQGNTLTKEALGSVHYISPEQAKGGRVDSRSDIYSLGVVMYEMMAGRPPYDGDSPVSVAIQHINGGAVMPSTLNPNIPGGLEQIIMKAMAHEIGDRYVSATRMLSDMDEFRKNPSLLFDYNVPPLDAVTKMPPPLVLVNKTPQPAIETELENSAKMPVIPSGSPSSAAERAARRAAMRSGTSGNSTQQNREREARRRAREQEEQRRRKAEEGSNRATTIAIIVCSLVLMFAIGLLCVFVVNRMNQKDEGLVTVPDLLNQKYEVIEVQNLALKVIYDNDDNVPAGYVITQNPTPGQSVVRGTTVTVTVSLGAEERKVPSLTNKSAEEAVAILEEMDFGLEVEQVTEGQYNATILEGYVIETDPPAGAALQRNQKVIVYVSMGPEPGTMPNLEGMTKKQAEKALSEIVNRLDLKNVEYKYINDNKIEKDVVIGTEPEPEASLKKGQTITIYLSEGPELIKMPDIMGKSVKDATTIMENAGFLKFKFDKEDLAGGVIIEQPYSPGEEVPCTEELVLKVGQNEVTKSVVIDLSGVVVEDGSIVEIRREGVSTPKYKGTIPAEGKITLKDEVGKGTVTYRIYINGSEIRAHEEKFS